MAAGRAREAYRKINLSSEAKDMPKSLMRQRFQPGTRWEIAVFGGMFRPSSRASDRILGVTACFIKIQPRSATVPRR